MGRRAGGAKRLLGELRRIRETLEVERAVTEEVHERAAELRQRSPAEFDVAAVSVVWQGERQVAEKHDLQEGFAGRALASLWTSCGAGTCHPHKDAKGGSR